MSQQFSSKIQVLWEKFLQAECSSYEVSLYIASITITSFMCHLLSLFQNWPLCLFRDPLGLMDF